MNPPRLGLSLLRFFVPADQCDAVTGDLLEEFSERAKVLELAEARRWFWRQTWKTMGHFLVCPFRETPILTAVTILGSLLLMYFSKVPTRLAVRAILENYHPYYYVSAPLFWFIFDIPIASVLTPLLIGWITSAVAKSRAMAVMLTVSVLCVLPFVALIGRAYWRYYHPSSMWYFSIGDQALRVLLSPISFLIGGLLRGARLQACRIDSRVDV